jgi:DnaK suppressor protein
MDSQKAMTPVQTEETRRQLLRRRDELQQRQQRAERDLLHGTDPLVADAPDQAIQLQNDEVLRGIDSAAVLELSAIEAALARLEQGTYGICSQCRAPIDPRRLAAVPYATTCTQCAG